MTTGCLEKRLILSFSVIKSEINILFTVIFQIELQNDRCITFTYALDISVTPASQRRCSMWAPLSPSHAHPPRRVVRLGRLLASWRSTLSLSRSVVAWSTSCQTRWSPSEPRCASSRARRVLRSQPSFLASSRRVWSYGFLKCTFPLTTSFPRPKTS